MGIGNRRMRVKFQRPVITKDDFGEPDKSYVDICTSWALVQPILPRAASAESNFSDVPQANINSRIMTRNRRALKDLGPTDRAVWNGRVYDIRAVIFHDHRAGDLEILAEEHL